jgi:hypothetical protein
MVLPEVVTAGNGPAMGYANNGERLRSLKFSSLGSEDLESKAP